MANYEEFARWRRLRGQAGALLEPLPIVRAREVPGGLETLTIECAPLLQILVRRAREFAPRVGEGGTRLVPQRDPRMQRVLLVLAGVLDGGSPRVGVAGFALISQACQFGSQ